MNCLSYSIFVNKHTAATNICTISFVLLTKHIVLQFVVLETDAILPDNFRTYGGVCCCDLNWMFIPSEDDLHVRSHGHATSLPALPALMYGKF